MKTAFYSICCDLLCEVASQSVISILVINLRMNDPNLTILRGKILQLILNHVFKLLGVDCTTRSIQATKRCVIILSSSWRIRAQYRDKLHHDVVLLRRTHVFDLPDTGKLDRSRYRHVCYALGMSIILRHHFPNQRGYVCKEYTVASNKSRSRRYRTELSASYKIVVFCKLNTVAFSKKHHSSQASRCRHLSSICSLETSYGHPKRPVLHNMRGYRFDTSTQLLEPQAHVWKNGDGP